MIRLTFLVLLPVVLTSSVRSSSDDVQVLLNTAEQYREPAIIVAGMLQDWISNNVDDDLAKASMDAGKPYANAALGWVSHNVNADVIQCVIGVIKPYVESATSFAKSFGIEWLEKNFDYKYVQAATDVVTPYVKTALEWVTEDVNASEAEDRVQAVIDAIKQDAQIAGNSKYFQIAMDSKVSKDLVGCLSK